MPVFRSGKGQAPGWCELECFEFITLAAGGARLLERESAKEELIVCRGSVAVLLGDVETPLTEGAKLDIASSDAAYTLRHVSGDALLCRLQGRWQSVNSSGIFGARTATPPSFDTPYAYEKSTGFDNHYHDCDEYWIFFEGGATVASEGQLYRVGPGDCVATGMGWHHDVLSVEGGEPVRAVWFEGTLEGAKRVGHLWEPTHGKAEPKLGRA